MKGRDVVFFMMALFAAGWFAAMRLHWDIRASDIRGSDLSSYYTAGLLLREGKADRLYDVAPGDSILGDATSGPWAEAGRRAGVTRQHYYIYPPAFALVGVPLSFLDFETAMDSWLVLDLALLCAFGALYARVRGADLEPPEAAFLVVVCFFEFLPLIWALAIGQTSMIVLVLLSGTLLAWRRGAEGTAGLLLGLAVALKLTPALLTLFFFVKGRRKMAWISAAVFAGVQILSTAILGWEAHRKFFLEIVPHMSGGTAYFLNQSLSASFNRLLTSADVRQVDIVESAPARILAAAALAGLAAAGLRLLRRRAEDVPLGEEIQFGCVLILTLLASPISWVHHYLLALPAILAVTGNLAREPSPPLLRSFLAGGALLLIARKPHPDLFLEGPWRLLNSGATGGALILYGLGLRALRPRAREAAS